MQLAAMVASQNHNFVSGISSTAWLTDSGCNAHVTSDLSHLSNASEYNGEVQVSVGSGQSLPVTHSSCGILRTPSSSFSLSPLFRVPSISANLLSVHRLCVDNNCIVVFYSNNFFIQDKTSGSLLFQGPSVNGLYHIPSLKASFSSPHAFVASSGPIPHVNAVSSYSLWHNRLGHPCHHVFRTILSLLHLPCFKSNKCFCEHCLHGKMCKLPFSRSVSTTEFPLKIVHSDVWGPALEISVNGHKYYVSFVDDMSRYTWFFPLLVNLMFIMSSLNSSL